MVRCEKARFEFFQALFTFSEQHPRLRNTTEVIHVALDPETLFDGSQHEFMGGVLAELILHLHGLRELTLQHFSAKKLFSPIATLRRKKTLKLVNFEYNNIDELDMLSLLRSLPALARFKLVLTNNALEDEAELANHLPRFASVAEVEVFSQRKGRLDEARFREAVAVEFPDWKVPVS